MGSYEECRGPPQLFLLDKFDVTGAGGCLKRYTDPSFFRVETSSSGTTNAYVQREKRIRKAKKKGLNWRNGETSEVVSTSHANLHQLFLEECVVNSLSNPASRVKLKRRPNGVPLDSKNGKSYMDKLLKTPSPEHKVIHEVSVSSSLLKLPTHDHNESGVEALEVTPVSPDTGRKRSTPSSPNTQEIMLKPSINESIEVSTDDSLCQVPKSNTSFEAVETSCAFGLMTSENDIAVDGESKIEGSLNGYQSDDVSTEIDNYVDAPSTMESDMDTDLEWRVKIDFTSSNIERQLSISDANEEYLQTHSSDSQSTENSSLLDDGNGLYKKETSNFSSDSPSTSAENTLLEDDHNDAVEVFRPVDIPETEITGISSYQQTANEDVSVPHHPRPAVSDDACTGEADITSHKPDFGELTSSSCTTDSSPTHFDAEAVVREGGFMGPNIEHMSSTNNEISMKSINTEENWTNLVSNGYCLPIVSDAALPTGDDFPSLSAGNDIVDESKGENVPSISTVLDVPCHTRDNSIEMSAEFLHEDDSDKEDLTPSMNTVSTYNICNMISHDKDNNQEMMFSEIPFPCELDGKVPKLPEDGMSDHLDSPQNEDSLIPTLSEQKQLLFELDDEDPNVVYDAYNHFSCIVEPCHGKVIEETPLDNMSQIVNAGDHYSKSSVENQVDSPYLILSNIKEQFLDQPQAGLDSYDKNTDVKFVKEIATNGIPVCGSPKSSDVVGFQGTGIADDLSHLDSADMESSCCIQENLEEPTRRSEGVEMDQITCCMDSTGKEGTDITVASDITSLNDMHVRLVDIDSMSDPSDAVDISTVVTGSSVNADEDGFSLAVGLNKLKEECIPFYRDLGQDEFETNKNYLPDGHRESSSGEEVGQLEVATSQLDLVFSNTVNYDHPESEALDTVPKSSLDLEVENNFDLVSRLNTTVTQSSLEKSGLYGEQESGRQSTEDVSYFPINRHALETILQEKIELLPNKLNEELPDAGETHLELLAQSKCRQKLDHDDHEGYNVTAFKSSELQAQGNCDNDVSGHPKYPLHSIFPPINLLSETNQINLEESPPLPPLPPLQWRIRTLHYTYHATEREMEQHTVGASSSELAMGDNEKAPSLNPKLPVSTATEKDSPSVHECASANVEHSGPFSLQVVTMDHPSTTKNYFFILDRTSSAKASLIFPKSYDEMTQHSFLAGEGRIRQPTSKSISQGISLDSASADDVGSSLEELSQSPHQVAAEITSNEDKVEHSYSGLDANIMMHKTVDLLPKTQTEQPQLVLPSSGDESRLPFVEDDIENGCRTTKLSRPRNPLIDAVAANDKSKLRKVMERVRPKMQSVDEKGSFLEQIRTKSFNLKPAVMAKPNIQGPNTNLKVAALLEKAKTIRQALSGSDEDDEDSWSDS
ncbi:Protein SCAR [Abeliophyllum distichum]|uniref:Protein SCAR n=1 Tax=Abeliophyllum distichum TaxID=126358 RepID=A0ABD1QT44_9LAMI